LKLIAKRWIPRIVPRHLKGSKLNLSTREAAFPDQAINQRKWIRTGNCSNPLRAKKDAT
jgi:hypothetical protein